MVIPTRLRSSETGGCAAPARTSLRVVGARSVVNHEMPSRSRRPPVTDHHRMGEAEAAPDPLDLRGEGGRIARRPFEHRYGHRALMDRAPEPRALPGRLEPGNDSDAASAPRPAVHCDPGGLRRDSTHQAVTAI